MLQNKIWRNTHTHTHTGWLFPFCLLPSGFSILSLYWSSEISHLEWSWMVFHSSRCVSGCNFLFKHLCDALKASEPCYCVMMGGGGYMGKDSKWQLLYLILGCSPFNSSLYLLFVFFPSYIGVKFLYLKSKYQVSNYARFTLINSPTCSQQHVNRYEIRGNKTIIKASDPRYIKCTLESDLSVTVRELSPSLHSITGSATVKWKSASLH